MFLHLAACTELMEGALCHPRENVDHRIQAVLLNIIKVILLLKLCLRTEQSDYMQFWMIKVVRERVNIASVHCKDEKNQ